MHTPAKIALSVPMSADLIAACTERPIILLDVLTEAQRMAIKSFVFDHLEDKDGAPEIEELSVTFFRYDTETAQGTFRIHFYINRRFCCSDVESSRQDYLDFSFRYSREGLQASADYFDWNLM